MEIFFHLWKVIFKKGVIRVKHFKNFIKIIIGSFLIGISISLFYNDLSFIPPGIFGITFIYNYLANSNFGLSLLLINIIFLCLTYIFFDKNILKKEIIPFILIPLFIILTYKLNRFFNIIELDRLLASIYAGVLIGIGSRIIYKENAYVSGLDIISLVDKYIFKDKKLILIYLVNILVILFSYKVYGLSNTMYSLIAIIISEIISRKIFLGLNNSKVFYIITKKEKEVKKYIIDEFHYDLTEFNVKGGYSQNKNRILMTVIPSSNYFKLREGIRKIDSEAFISITDSYEVINENIELKY